MANPQEQTPFSSIDEPTQFKWWLDAQRIKYNGFWFKPEFIESSKIIKTQFKPLPSDIFLASFPKTGTTWLKALTISILTHNNSASNPNNYVSATTAQANDLLKGHNPHELVPFLEIETFGENPTRDITNMESPRVFSTHLPLTFLPETIKTSGCRVIYVTRHPADTFVSLWHVYKSKFGTQISIEEAFDEFCKGYVPAGPYFEHVLEFWQASRQKDNNNNNNDNNSTSRVLFVTYEGLKAKPEENVKKIAEFLGCGSVLENINGEIEKIVEKCSFERLSKMEANKESREDVHWSGNKFGLFFRKGVVGDWKNHLSPESVQELEKIAEIKWAGSGLDLKIFANHL